MMPANRLPDYIRQMIQAASDALTFTEGMDEADFMADLRTQRAVVMSLMIVGEAAGRIITEYPVFLLRPVLKSRGSSEPNRVGR